MHGEHDAMHDPMHGPVRVVHLHDLMHQVNFHFFSIAMHDAMQDDIIGMQVCEENPNFQNSVSPAATPQIN